jgi:hypothetical protein
MTSKFNNLEVNNLKIGDIIENVENRKQSRLTTILEGSDNDNPWQGGKSSDTYYFKCLDDEESWSTTSDTLRGYILVFSSQPERPPSPSTVSSLPEPSPHPSTFDYPLRSQINKPPKRKGWFFSGGSKKKSVRNNRKRRHTKRKRKYI